MTSSSLRRRLSGGQLSRLLEDPELAPALRALPAPALRQVILRVGLEDAGELIALASLEQLRHVFDEDLWQSARPGEDETFDAARFTTWLEILLEGGEALVADRLAELSEDFLVFAISQLVRVLDVGVLTSWASDPREAERLDRMVDEQLCQELDELLIVARRELGWDAVLTTLLALDERHGELLRSVLGRCAVATHQEIGSAEAFVSALRGEALLLEDARAERESRRAERGYVSPADARAFLALARSEPIGSEPMGSEPEPPELDPLTRAHFRDWAPRAREEEPASAAPGAGVGSPRGTPLRELLLEAGVERDTIAPPAAERGPFLRALDEIAESDPPTHQRLIEELAYLANVLVAGDASSERTWRPVEAAERVVEVCDDGLARLTAREGAAPARATLSRWGAVGAFRLGWASRRRPTPSDRRGNGE